MKFVLVEGWKAFLIVGVVGDLNDNGLRCGLIVGFLARVIVEGVTLITIEGMIEGTTLVRVGKDPETGLLVGKFSAIIQPAEPIEIC